MDTNTHTHTNTLRRTHTQISKHMCTSTHTLQRTPLHCIQHHLEHVTPASAAAATPPTATPSAAAAAADETGQARAGADLSFSSVASAADFSSYLFHLSIIWLKKKGLTAAKKIKMSWKVLALLFYLLLAFLFVWLICARPKCKVLNGCLISTL